MPDELSPKKPRKSGPPRMPPEVKAISQFCKTIEPCSDRAKWAAVRYLMGLYQGDRPEPNDDAPPTLVITGPEKIDPR